MPIYRQGITFLPPLERLHVDGNRSTSSLGSGADDCDGRLPAISSLSRKSIGDG